MKSILWLLSVLTLLLRPTIAAAPHMRRDLEFSRRLAEVLGFTESCAVLLTNAISLKRAIACRDIELLKTFIANNAPINVKHDNPLTYALAVKDDKSAALLLANKANPLLVPKQFRGAYFQNVTHHSFWWAVLKYFLHFGGDKELRVSLLKQSKWQDFRASLQDRLNEYFDKIAAHEKQLALEREEASRIAEQAKRELEAAEAEAADRSPQHEALDVALPMEITLAKPSSKIRNEFTRGIPFLPGFLGGCRRKSSFQSQASSSLGERSAVGYLGSFTPQVCADFGSSSTPMKPSPPCSHALALRASSEKRRGGPIRWVNPLRMILGRSREASEDISSLFDDECPRISSSAEIDLMAQQRPSQENLEKSSAANPRPAVES